MRNWKPNWSLVPAAGAFLLAGLSLAGPSEVEIVYRFGVEGRNELDTASERFKKDMILDGQLTTKLTLSLAERQRILALAEELGFFKLPEVIPDNGRGFMTPCDSFYLEIRTDGRTHSVRWDDCDGGESPEKVTLAKVGAVIEEIIHSKRAYRVMPLPHGGYM